MMQSLWNRISARPSISLTLGLVAVLGIFLVLPVTLPRTLSVPCKVIPDREWMLVRSTSGGVMASINDHLHGRVQEYTVVNVVRGDAFRFDLSSNFSPGDVVRKGDTVVNIHSYELQRELHRLSGLLAVAKASLNALQSGEKESVEEEAVRVLLLARERERMLRQVALRQDSLYRKNLVSLEQYELARSEAAVASMEVGIVEARLQIVRTGAKPEQIQLIRSQIVEQEAEIKALRDQLSTLTMVAPFEGTFSSFPGTDTLCVVEESSRAVLVQVPARNLGVVAAGQKVSMRMLGVPSEIEGIILRVDGRVKTTFGQQVAYATADLAPDSPALPPGAVLSGSIEIARVSPFDYLRLWLSDLAAEFVDGV